MDYRPVSNRQQYFLLTRHTMQPLTSPAGFPVQIMLFDTIEPIQLRHTVWSSTGSAACFRKPSQPVPIVWPQLKVHARKYCTVGNEMTCRLLFLKGFGDALKCKSELYISIYLVQDLVHTSILYTMYLRSALIHQNSSTTDGIFLKIESTKLQIFL